jgi:hypothetical protein
MVDTIDGGARRRQKQEADMPHAIEAGVAILAAAGAGSLRKYSWMSSLVCKIRQVHYSIEEFCLVMGSENLILLNLSHLEGLTPKSCPRDRKAHHEKTTYSPAPDKGCAHRFLATRPSVWAVRCSSFSVRLIYHKDAKKSRARRIRSTGYSAFLASYTGIKEVLPSEAEGLRLHQRAHTRVE